MVNGLAPLKENTMNAHRGRSILLIAGNLLLAGNFGCIEMTPPPEAVLEGTWEVVPIDPLNLRLTHWYITFDSNGQLTQVRYTFVDFATVSWTDPHASVSVDGAHVHISATHSGNDLTFDGTLDSETAPTRAPGILTSNLYFGDLQITVSEGEATLVKQ
jgi:hypothetical protein